MNGGYTVKALYALVFVLYSVAAPAQTLETWIAAYHLDELDCFGETTQQSTMPPQIIGIELLCAAILDDANGVATTGSNGAEDVPVATIQPSYGSSTEKYLTGRDDNLTVDDTIEQGATSAQIIATEPTVEKLGDPKLSEADDVAVKGPNDAEDVPVGAIQPSDEHSTAKYSTGRDDTLTVDDTIEQRVTSAQTIATQPTIEALGEATLNEENDVAITGHGAKDVSVGAIQPSDENNDQLKADNTIAFIEDQSALYDE
jgi:hypothetical protein